MKILLVAGHGLGAYSNDSGAVGNGTTERDFIRKNIIPNVEKYLKQVKHKVVRYGGSTMNQDLFQDTRYGVEVGNYRDYGMYWVDRQDYDAVIEFHLDAASSASGGHVIIPYGLEADDIDKQLQKALEDTVGTLHGISERDNLLNCNVAKQVGVNYRLIELGFITSAKDMNYIRDNLQHFTKKIAEAIHGKAIGSSEEKIKQKKPKATKAIVVKKKATPKKEDKKPIESNASKVKKHTNIKKRKGAINMYTVISGDSLWAIATKYGVTVAQLKEWNKLTSDSIFVGQKLYVSKPATTTTTTTTTTSTNPYPNLRTKAEMLNLVKSYVGKAIDFDGYYGLNN